MFSAGLPLQIVAIFALLRLIVCTEIVDQLSNILGKSVQNPNYQQLSQEIIESKFPFAKTTCIKDALGVFLPMCLKHGMESISPSLRAETAMKLSVCEFEASGIHNVPLSCKSTEETSLMDCMMELERSPQWWTTYSGNYQHLSSICFENSLPYEKDQILELFLNITDVYGEFYQNMESQIRQAETQMENQSRENFERLQSMFEVHFNGFSKAAESQQEEFKEQFGEFQNEVFSTFSQSLTLFQDQFTDADSNMLNNVELLQSAFQNIVDEVRETNIVQEINTLKLKNLESWKEVTDTSERAISIQENYLQEVDKVFQQFYFDSHEKIQNIHAEMTQSQLETIDLIQDFNSLIQNSIIPSLTDDLVPHFEDVSEQIMSKVAMMDLLVSHKFDEWNEQLDIAFSKVNGSLNSTIEKIHVLNDDLTTFQDNFKVIFSVLKHIGNTIRYILIFVKRVLFKVKIGWISMGVCMVVLKYRALLVIPKVVFNSHRNGTTNLLFRCVVVCFAITMGSMVGSLLIPRYSHQGNS